MNKLKYWASIILLFIMVSCGKKSSQLLLDKAVNPWSELVNTDSTFRLKTIYSMVTDKDGSLYAAGWIENPKWAAYSSVVKWTGSKWVPLGGADAFVAYDYIYAIATDDAGNVYATYFNMNYRSCVVKWNGSKWSNIGDDALFAKLIIYSMVVESESSIYVGLHAERFNTRVAKWDGTSWKLLQGVPSSLNSIKIALNNKGNLLCAADDSIFNWNGNSWVVFGGNKALKAGGGEIKNLIHDGKGGFLAGGYFRNSKDQFSVSKWNGDEWTEIDCDNTIGVHALCTDVYGNIYIVRGSTLMNNYHEVLKWDGNSWSELGGFKSLSYPGKCESIVADEQGNVYAAISDNTMTQLNSARIFKYTKEHD